MLPRVIIHNSISLDGSLTNFDVYMDLHYQIAGKYKPNAHLIGSNTIKTGIELYGNISQEEENDFKKPSRDENLPYWVIIDTKGSLQGILHMVRRFEFCKDVVVLISEKTSKDYINYLKERDYDFCIVGNEHINLKKSLEYLFKKYKVKNLLTDCGRILSNLLLNQGFVNEISLLIHPVFVGDKSYYIFDNVNKKIFLKQLKNVILGQGHIWLVYKVTYS
jgi:2,5-diamino-6-(ribosylamino)-4(3H)-pyrimidinone 5'-phosphate reductase